MEDVLITMRDIRKAGMCSRGARSFFIRHGLDWDLFLKKGVPAQAVWDTGDAMARQVVEVACGRKQ